MAPTTIIPTHWQTHHAELSKIRSLVFMDEQQVSAADEWDGLDETATHFLLTDNNQQAIGCARLLIEEHGKLPAFHIGRVAILKPWRDQGLGTALMRFIIGYCQELAPGNCIYLHAQCARQSFYEALGFVAKGDVFMDAGIAHISMYYTISQES